MNKTKVNLDNNLILKSENVEYNNETLKNTLDKIIESGSNDNGSWIKYSDGTMICYGSKDVTLDCSQAWGNLFVGRYENYINFPQEFIDIPLLQIHTRSTTNASSWLISYDSTAVSKSNFYEVDIARATANSSVPIKITFIAIGRWK